MLANKIKETLDKYLDVEKNYIQREEFENFIKNNNVIQKDIEDYFFKVSAGQGTPAVIPWWGIFNKNVTTKGASQGYYVIFLFKADMSGVYLSLNFGAEEFNEKYSTKGISIDAAADYYRNILLEKFKFNFNKMDLGKHPEGKKSSGQGDYENGNIYSILYEKNNLPDDEKLVADLIKFMKMYNYLLSERGNELFSEDEINNITNSDEYLDNTNKIDNFNSEYMAYQRNKIFFGAPGTGKSYELNKQKGKLLDEYSENYERVTFHPDYSYANFVGTYKPIPKGDNDISYDFVEGPFLRILTKALKKPSEPFLLIIEEINRANVAAVFGDIFQLLDRDKNYCSEYPINISEDMKRYFKKVKVTKKELPDERLFIPHNMFIWATMNSADQGVFFMDTAFKRRWEFTHININNNEEKIKDKYYKLNEENINWNNLRKSINSYLLDENINEDKCLGPFFISDIVKYGSITPQDFMDSFKNKVLMYLFEDAGKSKRDSIFEGSKKDNEDFTYSKICKDFDKNGINIFHSKIIKEYKSMNGQDDK